MKRHLVTLGFVALLVLGGGCKSPPPLSAFHRIDTAAQLEADGATVNLERDGFAGLRADLRPGDIIMGTRTDPTSTLMRLSLDTYSYYTHSGIVDVRDGQIVVSHAAGRFRLFQRSPRLLGKVEGTVSAVRLEKFIRDYHDVRVVRLPDPEKNRQLASLTRVFEAEELTFDPFFDTLDPEGVHCSEYTLRAIRQAGYEDPRELPRRTPNHSMSKLLYGLGVETERFVSVDGFGAYPGATIVAEVSRFARPETSLALADAFRVLHERINDDPNAYVGDLVGCTPERLIHFTPATEAYLRGAIGLADAGPTLDPNEVQSRSEILFNVIYESGLGAATASELPR